MSMYFFGPQFQSADTPLPFSCHILSYRFSKFCTAKIKKYGQCCHICFENYSSMKEYNDLKQRLMKIEMKILECYAYRITYVKELFF